MTPTEKEIQTLRVETLEYRVGQLERRSRNLALALVFSLGIILALIFS